jgi:hypothetical protein
MTAGIRRHSVRSPALPPSWSASRCDLARGRPARLPQAAGSTRPRAWLSGSTTTPARRNGGLGRKDGRTLLEIPISPQVPPLI